MDVWGETRLLGYPDAILFSLVHGAPTEEMLVGMPVAPQLPPQTSPFGSVLSACWGPWESRLSEKKVSLALY